MNVAVNTVPEGDIIVRLVQDTDRDAGATGKTLTVGWIKAGATSYTVLTSGTHYNASEMTDGLYAIEFIDDANGQGLFDTVGSVVVRISATGADEYYERFDVFTPANVPATPAMLSQAERDALASATVTINAKTALANSAAHANDPEDISLIDLQIKQIGDVTTSGSESAPTVILTDPNGNERMVINVQLGTAPTSPAVGQSIATS